MALVWAISGAPVFFGVSRCPSAMMFHRPCPGCGMTRAIDLLSAGDVLGSLAMHPLAVPALLVQAAVAVGTVAVTFTHGTPLEFWRVRWGRAITWALAVVGGLAIALWIARWLGAFGGPIPV